MKCIKCGNEMIGHFGDDDETYAYNVENCEGCGVVLVNHVWANKNIWVMSDASVIEEKIKKG